MQDKNRGIWIEDWIAEITEHERLFALLYTLCLQNGKPDIELGISYIAERLHKTERTVRRWIADMIEEGCITVDVKRGRNARNTFKLNMTLMSDFIDEKTGQLLQKNRTPNMTHMSDFSGLPLNPSSDKKRENNKKNIKTKKSPQKKVFSSDLDDGQNFEEKEEFILFREDEEARAISPDVKKSFGEFWKKFAPVEKEQTKYKRALNEWNRIGDVYRSACLKMLDKLGKPLEQNPYFYLQHFGPVFLNEKQCYEAWKQHVQLCRVRFEDKQPICSAWMAEIFQLTVLDDHYEKRFDR